MSLDRPRETVVQFANSCPAQLNGFLHQMSLDHDQHMLSCSPSLAVMRDHIRQNRGPYHHIDPHRISLDRLSLDEREEENAIDDNNGVFDFELQ
jgi:hypothetical protein